MGVCSTLDFSNTLTRWSFWVHHSNTGKERRFCRSIIALPHCVCVCACRWPDSTHPFYWSCIYLRYLILSSFPSPLVSRPLYAFRKPSSPAYPWHFSIKYITCSTILNFESLPAEEQLFTTIRLVACFGSLAFFSGSLVQCSYTCQSFLRPIFYFICVLLIVSNNLISSSNSHTLELLCLFNF